MNNIFADRYQGFLELNSRATAVDEQAKKQHDKDYRSFGKYDYNPWQDIIPDKTHRIPTQASDAVGYNILINMDNKLSFDDLKEDNIVMDPLEIERCTYQWSKPHAQKSAEQASTDSTCSNKASQLNWGNRANELRSQHEDALASGIQSRVCREEASVVSTDRKRKKVKANDYPQWTIQGTTDDAVREKKQRKINKHNAREHKRKVNSKEDVEGPCSQCKRKNLISMDDEEVFTDGNHWLPA